MLLELAAWAGIAAVPLACAGILVPFAVAVSGRQRDLRQQLREALYPIAQSANRFQNGTDTDWTYGWLEALNETLLKISKRDGLRAPNPMMLGAMSDSLAEVISRKDIPDELPHEFIEPQQREQLLSNNAGWIEYYTLRAGAQAAWMIEASLAIDRFNYRVYRKAKNAGMEDTHFHLPSFKRSKE